MTDTDIVKLTAYFAERERTGGRFLAEGILDLFDSREIATSVLSRGIASFGPRGVVRSDESLSMSEDLPVAITAIDSPARIAAVVDEVTAMTRRGLITMERGRIATGELTGPAGDATQITLLLGRQQRIAGSPAYFAVCDILYRSGFAGAATFLGVDGTVDGQRRRAKFFSRNLDVPVLVVGVGTAQQAASASAELRALLSDPLLMVERVRICKRNGELVERPHQLPAADASGHPLFQKLSIHTPEDALYRGQPIHRVLLRGLRESAHASGATVLRGLWGFHDGRAPHGDRLLQLSRHVPVTTVIVDTPAGIAASFKIVDEVTAERGLVTSEMVPAAILIDRGHQRGDPELGRHDY
jgi:PII-like signaling protein